MQMVVPPMSVVSYIIANSRVVKTAVNFLNDNNHIFNHCYIHGRQSFISAKTRTTRYHDRFIPTSNQILNKAPSVT